MGIQYHYLLFLLVIALPSCNHIHRISRSSFRTYKEPIAQITTKWEHADEQYTCISSNYAQSPIFDTFDENYIAKYALPETITLAHTQHLTVSRSDLEEKMYRLLEELYAHRKQFKDFEILQRKNFNRHKHCGLLVLKFKEYPLVLKLFMETPKTFTNPYCKGIEPITFFFMAGGSNRHIAGLTRIKNLEAVNTTIATLPAWNSIVHTPRKWFWIPSDTPYIEITGEHICPNTVLKTRLPSIYAIIADEIDTREHYTCTSSERNHLVMQLCCDLKLTIDPHTDNYVLRKDSASKQHHITILDTELFPAMVGLQEEVQLADHTSWYLYLINKYVHDALGHLKDERKIKQLHSYALN